MNSENRRRNRVALLDVRAQRLIQRYGPILNQLAKPASQLIREQAHPGQIMHALVWLASRLLWVADVDAAGIDARRLVDDGGWLHQWSEHLDPHTGPMPRRAQLVLAKRVEQVERRLPREGKAK